MTDAFGAPSAATLRAEDRVKRDRWKRYLLPDPETGEEVPWTRVTTINKCIADMHNLERWKQRQAVRGVALRADLLALAASVNSLPSDDPQAKETLNDVVKQAQAAAGSSSGANLGKALHTATEQLDRGTALRQISLPEPYDRDLYAYDQARRAAGMVTKPEHIERVVVIPSLRVAGTLDRLTFWRGGRRIKDVKTGQSADEFGQLELAVQMALYANASYMWNLDTQQYEPMPEVEKDWGILAHLPAGQGRAAFHPVNIAAGWDAALVAHEVHSMRKEAKTLVGVAFDLPATLPAAAIVAHASATQDARMAHNPHASAEDTHDALALPRAQLAAALRTATSHEQLTAIAATAGQMGEEIWTPDLRAAAARRWEELSDAPPRVCPGCGGTPATSKVACDECDLLNTIEASRSHEELSQLHAQIGVQRWTAQLRDVFTRQWNALGEAMQLKALAADPSVSDSALGAAVLTDSGIGGPGLFAKRVLNARTREELGALYEEGIASGDGELWTEDIAALAFAVMAAYVEPCPVTSAPHGDTLACGCGYNRPEALGA